MGDQQFELHRGGRQRGGFIFNDQKKTVRDHITGLLWLRNANNWGRPMMWQDAVNKVNRMNYEAFDGVTGWRLPTKDELITISSYAVSAQADLPRRSPFQYFSDLGFDNVIPDWYWTSTPYIGVPNSDPNTFKFCVNMSERDFSSYDVSDKCYVWPVSDSV